MYKINEISKEEGKKLLESSDVEGDYKPRGLFYIKKNTYYTGIDNSSGCAFTEDFNNIEGCILWLQGEET